MYRKTKTDTTHLILVMKIKLIISICLSCSFETKKSFLIESVSLIKKINYKIIHNFKIIFLCKEINYIFALFCSMADKIKTEFSKMEDNGYKCFLALFVIVTH